jgi:hypothetical protein
MVSSARRRLAPLAACLLLAPFDGAFAASCGESSAHEAFDVQGLKSELMVTALSCNAKDQYDSFIGKFRPNLLAEEERLNGYFRTTYGKNAQREHDNYITELANVQSKGGLRAGTIFCQQRMAMFDEVGVLESSADLARYAEAKDIVQPASYAAPEAPSRPAIRRAPVKRRPRT